MKTGDLKNPSDVSAYGVPSQFLTRVDCSVNKAYVDDAHGLMPTLITKTGTNTAGAYNGGGTGNKAILGYRGYHQLALGSLTHLALTWRDLTPDTASVVVLPAINLVVDVSGSGASIKIFTLNQALPAGATTFTTASFGSNRYLYDWQPSVNRVQIVLDLPGVTPVVDLGGGNWTAHAYNMADVLAVYPSARLLDVNSADGGMPASFATPAMIVNSGDSSNLVMSSKLIESFLINGSAA